MNRNGNDVPSSPLYTFYELLLPEFTEINSDGEVIITMFSKQNMDIETCDFISPSEYCIF